MLFLSNVIYEEGVEELDNGAKGEEVKRQDRVGKRVLVADDDNAIRAMLCEYLFSEGITVSEAHNGLEVLAAIESDPPDLVVMDMRMPELDGITVLRQSQGSGVPFIVMTAYGGSNSAIQAAQLGAYDYITKPFDLEEVMLTIDRLFEWQRLTREVRSLRERVEKRDPSERIIGNSAAMQEVYKMIGRVAGTESTVLISGETGTGKELVAQTIHSNSTYRSGPLIKVNCAALPETLLENELFGHEKGSYTGASEMRRGRFELAHKGSIFLDEIGEMSLNIQRKFLRVLQEREIERVGGTVAIKIDTRVIAATNRRLEDEVAAGRFRQDLYYRLNVITIHLPPLRERKEDIPLLVEHFLDKHRYSDSDKPARISSEALDMIQEYDWPGNVRELENTLERAVVMAQGGVITSHHIIFSGRSERSKIVDVARLLREQATLRSIISEAEKLAIIEALEQANGDRSKAAAALGINRQQLYSRMRDYGLSA